MKAVIFDIDNTLYSYDDAHAPAYRALQEYARAAFDLAPDDFDALHSRASRLLEERAGRCAAIHNRLIRYQLILEDIGRSIEHAPAMADCYWSTFLDHVRPFEGLAQVLDRLKAMGMVVGIGTNMTADRQYDKLERLDIFRDVDFMVTSEEVSAEKPDVRLFRACAAKAGCEAGECVFIGDSLKGDVLGAINAGMKAVWLCPSGQAVDLPEAARAIGSLCELPDLLAIL